MNRPLSSLSLATFGVGAALLLSGLHAPLEAQIEVDSRFAGDWSGTLPAQGTELPIVFHLTLEADGGYSATVDSPAQGAMGIPVSTVTVAGDSITMEITAIQGQYRGVLEESESTGTTIRGNWSQGGASLSLDLTPSEGEPVLNRPQHPEPPFPYQAEEVSFANPEGGHTLAGTLTLPPSGDDPHPAVVLITGSGPQDRDETLMGHKPFWVIADHLTREGIAVLRFDDRGVNESTGDFGGATGPDFATDVEAAIDFLKSRSEIDESSIGLVGHSEGGLIGPMVAKDSDDVAFLVLLAGTGLTGEEILELQGALILKANGASESTIEANRTGQKAIFRALKQGLDGAELEQVVRTHFESLSPADKQALGVTEESFETIIQNQMQGVSSPWFRHFLIYDPRPALREITIPVLALNGELDLQVPFEENLSEIQVALEEAGNSRYRIESLPGLNHLFQHAVTGSPAEYGQIVETFAVEALEIMSEWILEVVRPK